MKIATILGELTIGKVETSNDSYSWVNYPYYRIELMKLPTSEYQLSVISDNKGITIRCMTLAEIYSVDVEQIELMFLTMLSYGQFEVLTV